MNLFSQSEINKDYLPNSTLKNSLIIIVVLFLFLFLFLFFIRLNTTISVSAEIIDANTTNKVFSSNEGIFHVMVNEGDTIGENQVIGFYEKDFNHGKLLKIYDFYSGLKLEEVLSDAENTYSKLALIHLGTEFTDNNIVTIKKLLLEYTILITKEKQILFTKSNYLAQLERSAAAQLRQYTSIAQIDTVQKKLAYNQLQRDSFLYINNVTSTLDWETVERNTNKDKKQILENKIEQLNSEAKHSGLLFEKEKEKVSFLLSKFRLECTIGDELNNLQCNVEKWKLQNIVYSKANGIVSLRQIEKRIKVRYNDLIMSILTLNPNREYHAYINIPKNKISYLNKGKKVHIRIDDYPYMEYGSIESEIINIPEEANDTFFRCVCRINNELKTNYNHQLKKRSSYIGHAEISLKKESLFDKIKQKLLWEYQNYQQ